MGPNLSKAGTVTQKSATQDSWVNEAVNGSCGSREKTLHDRLSCIFCRIVDGNDPDFIDKILFQDEELVVFPDHVPAARNHLLVVTKEHIRDAKVLTPEEIPLVQRMVNIGKKVLAERVKSEIEGLQDTSENPSSSVQEIVSKALIGFHWPPRITVPHLHLHVIAPREDMDRKARDIFRKNSYWFVEPSWVIQRLKRRVRPKI